MQLVGDGAPKNAAGGITSENGTDARLKGFPSMLDKEIVQMAIPSLAAIVVDPLMGMVDVGAPLDSITRFAITARLRSLTTKLVARCAHSQYSHNASRT